MKDVAVRLAERGVALAVTDAALDVILSLSYDPVCASFKYHHSPVKE
jgi:ATP-dependent Clp protease ATP-binding subunit ClpB